MFRALSLHLSYIISYFVLVDYIVKRLVLSFTNLVFINLLLEAFPCKARFGIFQVFELFSPHRKSLLSVLVLLSEEVFELPLSHFFIIQFVDLRLTEVNQVRGERVTEHLVVDVHRSLGNREESPLTDVVLEPEVVIVEDAGVIERVGLWDQITCQWLVLGALWRVDHR